MPRVLSHEDALAALQALQTRAQVAAFFGVSQRRFDYHLYVKPTPYRRIEIPKKGTGSRVLHAPPEPVKIFQKMLANYLRDAYPDKRGVHGFCLDGGVVANAKVHVRARILLNLDLADFFGAISFARVHGMFRSQPFGMSKAAASMLAHLCCWKGRLPQGAPTSPMVSNWICRRLDTRLGRLARKHRCLYTRYADDITFSTRRATLPPALVKFRAGHDVELGEDLLAAISGNWFEVNQSKVWVRTMREHQEVTGLVVNEKLNVTRRYRRSLRALLHDWEVNGLAHAQDRFHTKYDDRTRVGGGKPALLDHAGGKLEFLRHVKGPADPLYVRYAVQFEQLRRREGCTDERPVRLVGEAAARHEFLRQALWVIVARERAGKTELWNGTGFSLDGVGVVTNAHVVTPDAKFLEAFELEPADVEFVARPGTSHGGAWQDVHPTRISQHHDLAVFEPKHASITTLTATTATPVQGDDILLAGFPNWQSGDPVRFENATVTHHRTQSMVHWIQVSATIEEGNSGGPVLDTDGKVIGVATKGHGGVPLAHAAVSIAHLADLKELPGPVGAAPED